MPNRKENYVDLEKYRKTCLQQKRRYFAKTQGYQMRRWTFEEDIMVLMHDIPDSELSAKIKRSVSSIQRRRYRLKKEIEF